MIIGNPLLLKQAADSTPAEDPVTRSLRLAAAGSWNQNTGDSSAHLDRNSIGTPTDGTKWTFSAWVKKNEIDSRNVIFSGGTNSSNWSVFRFRDDAQGNGSQLFYDDYTNGSDNYQWRWSPKLRDPSAWYNLMLVYDASQSAMADKLKLYINGVLASSDFTRLTAPTTHVMSPNKSGMNQIIGNNSSNDAKANLLIADVYFLDGVAKTVTGGVTDFTESNSYGGLKPKEYTGTDFGNNGFHLDMQPSHDADLLVSSIDRNDGDTDFADAAKGHTLTTGGEPEHSIAVGNPFTGDDRAVYFDGSSDYLTSTDAKDDANFDNSDWTLEFWINPSNTFGSAVEHFMGCGGGHSGWNSTTGHSWIIFAYNSTNEIYFQWWNGSTNVNMAASDDLLPKGTWTHVAVVNQSGTKRFYIGGVQVDTDSNTKAATSNPTTFNVGVSAATANKFNGYLYDVSIQRGYCKYEDGTTFTPPTSKITADSNTEFLLQPEKDDSSFEDESSNGHTVSTQGSPTTIASTPYEAAAKSTAIYFDGTGDNLVVTSDSSFNEFGTEDFTIEMWVNPTDQGSGSFAQMFELYGSSSDRMYLRIERQSSQNVYKFVNDGTNDFDVESDSAPDYGNWQHLAVVRNGTSITMYVDGTAQTDSVTISSSAAYNWASTNLNIGKGSVGGSSADYEGYIFDYRITKGTARYTSDFSSDLPSAPFELNPVYIGGDQSGNKNHFQPTNISSHDVMLDTPTKNYCTLNPLDKPVYSSRTPAVLTEGNVKAVLDDLTGITGTIGINQSSATSSKWYVEYYYISQSGAGGDDRACFGFEGTDHAIDNSSRGYNINLGTGSGWEFVCLLSMNGAFQNMANNPTGYNLGSNVTVDDIVGVAFDLENNKFYAHKNGYWGDGSGWNQSSFSNASGMDIPSGKTWVPAIYNQGGATATVAFNGGGDPTFGGNKTSGQDTSQSEFYYAPPSGYKSLNTSNLAAPSVTPSEHFDVLTYNGSGSSQNVTGVNFDVGMAWIKDRDNKANNGNTADGIDYYGNYLFDTITGTSTGGYNIDADMVSGGSGPYLNSSDSGVTSFSAGSGTSRGITVDDAEETNFHYNDGYSSYTERYVAWLWKLGSTGDSSSWNGSYTAPNYEHYNDSAGITTIDVTPVSSGNLEVAHSLSAAPEFFFVTTDGMADFYGFPAFHKDLTSEYYLSLDDNSSQSSDSTYFPSGAAHADYIKLGSAFIDSEENMYGNNLRIWAFTGVEGYSKFGKYTGNGISDGPMVHLSFRPKFFMYKQATGTTNWVIVDAERETYNTVDLGLFPNLSTNEQAGSSSNYKMDFLSNGVKIRTSASGTNANNQTFIYAAFAEQPFAAPSNAR